MNSTDLRLARKQRGWNQSELAERLGVSQGYVSLLESGARAIPAHLVPAVVRMLRLPPSTLLPTDHQAALPSDAATGALAALGYPGFSHVGRARTVNPAELLFRTLQHPDVEARVVEALPWLVMTYPTLDWSWLVPRVKQHDLQNRLGFVVTLARELAERRHLADVADSLRKWELALEGSRLLKPDTFGRSTLTAAERKWLTANRSPAAAYWNVLSNVSADALAHA